MGQMDQVEEKLAELEQRINELADRINEIMPRLVSMRHSIDTLQSHYTELATGITQSGQSGQSEQSGSYDEE